MIAVLRVAALLLTRCNAWHLVRHTTPLQLRAASDAVDASAEALAAFDRMVLRAYAQMRRDDDFKKNWMDGS